MQDISLNYIDETYDENGKLLDYKLKYPENFNFAYDIVDEIARLDPTKKAMIWCNEAGEEHIFTFADMKKYSDKTANMFARHGVKKGDRVLVVLKRHYQFWFTILALHKIGAVIIPATFLLTKHDVEYRCNSAEVTCVVATGESGVLEHFNQALPNCPTVKKKFVVNGQSEGWLDFTLEMQASSDEWQRVQTNVHEPMILYFSSGTTGNPKMVLHAHTYSIGHLITARHWHQVKSDGLHLTIADTGWGKAVWGKLYGQWFMQGCIFVYDFDKFVGADLLRMIEKYKITTLCCPPTMFRFFMLEDLDKFDLSSLEYCTIAGEALNPDVFDNWYKHTGIKLMEGFGQTETTLMIANLTGMEPKPGSMGKPVPHYDVDIVDYDGNSVAPGVTGEIVVHTDKRKPEGLFECYYRNEERTKEQWHDGLYHTGDTAWKDEDGYYWYVGRTDDVIKSSGYRIGPFEIESVLLQHDAVLECAVTGVPDEIRGNLVKATIVLAKGYEPSDELVKELQTYVKKETAPYKYPRVVEFVESLPKTVNGKIRRAAIREADNKKD